MNQDEGSLSNPEKSMGVTSALLSRLLQAAAAAQVGMFVAPLLMS